MGGLLQRRQFSDAVPEGGREKHRDACTEEIALRLSLRLGWTQEKLLLVFLGLLGFPVTSLFAFGHVDLACNEGLTLANRALLFGE